jgi:hypothetical protein
MIIMLRLDDSDQSNSGEAQKIVEHSVVIKMFEG